MQLSLKKKLIFYIMVITAVVLIISGLIITPTITKIISLKTDINNIQQELENRYEQTQKLKRSLKELTAIKENTQKFANTTIEAGDELKVITELEKIASEHNIEQNTSLKLIDIALGENKKNPKINQYYQFSFLNNGYVENHLEYLKALENLPYYLTINNLIWEKHKGLGEEKNKITLRFEAIIYVESN